MSNDLGLFTLTKPVRSIHPSLLEARAFMRDGKASGEPKFGISLLFPPENDDFKAIKTLLRSIAVAKWPKRNLKGLKFPFTDGTILADKRKEKTGKDDGEVQRGMAVLSAKSKYRPQLGYVEKGKIISLTTDAEVFAAKDKFYFGVEVYASLRFVAYEGGSNSDGVTAYLQSVLSTVRGERLAGSRSVAETFKSYIGEMVIENPLVGVDEIPF